MISKTLLGLCTVASSASLVCCVSLLEMPDRYYSDDSTPPSDVTVADASGDARTDVATSDAGPDDVRPGVEPSDASPPDAPPSPCGRKDYNCDGRYDLLLFNEWTGTLVSWILDGDKLIDTLNIVEPDGTPTRVPRPLTVMTTGKFSANGVNDLVIHDKARGTLEIWEMRGRTHVATKTVTAGEGGPPVTKGAAWWATSIDVDGDGNSDLLWHDPAGGRLTTWLMVNEHVVREADTAEIGTNSIHELSAGWVISGTADFDGDSLPDILLVLRQTNETHTFYMKDVLRHSFGYGRLPQDGDVQKASAPLSQELEDLGDIDGDGRPEWVWRDARDGAVIYWRMGDVLPSEVVDGWPRRDMTQLSWSAIRAIADNTTALLPAGVRLVRQ